MRLRGALPPLVFGLVVLGCGKGDELPALHPVKGRVLHKDGKPVSGGKVQFLSEKDQPDLFVNAEVDAEGRFELKTRKRDRAEPGAPEGSYQAVYIPPGGMAADETDPAKAQSASLPIRLPTTYKVKAKANEITLYLPR